MKKQMKYWLALVVSLTLATSFAAAGEEPGHKHDSDLKQEHAHGQNAQKQEHAHEAAHDDEHADEHEQGHAEGEEIHVSVAAQKLIGIRTERIARRAVQETVVLRGRLERAPTALTAVAAPIGGRISLKVRPFAPVAAGDVLFTVSSPDLRARREEIDVLARRLANYTQSGAKNAALAAELDTKRRARAAALDGATEQGGVVEVRAPRAGIAQTPMMADGTRVETGALVLTIADPSDLRFKGRVAPSDLAKLRDGMAVEAQGVAGRIQIPSDETDVAYALFEKPLPGARAGTPLAVVCATAASAGETPCVPNEAIVMMGVTPTIFVRAKGEDDAFVAVAVEPGVRGRDWTELKHLADTDREVVVRGQYELKLALASQKGGGKKAGHFHADGIVHDDDHE